MAENEKIIPKTPDVVDLEGEGVSVLNNIIYAHTEDGDLRADCFWDDENTAKKPVIIWIHAGGLTELNNTRKTRPESAFLQLVRRGYFVASLDYRMAQTRKFPAALEDCKCAVRYFRKHAEKYNIDPDKIGVWGGSVGGQIAGLMGVQGGIAEYEDKGGWAGVSSDVQAVVSWYGGLSFKTFIEARKDTCEEQERGFDSFRARFEFIYGGTIEESQELIEKIDPMTYVNRRLAPMLAMCSDSDPRIGEDVSRVFCLKAQENGNDVIYETAPGQGHGFFKGEEFYDKVYNFFDKYLKN